MTTGSKKLLLITGAVALTTILYLAPRNLKKSAETKEEIVFSFEGINKEAKGQLKRQEAETIIEVEKALEKDPSSVSLNDSLGKMWDRFNMPQVSSHYFEEVALKEPTEANWVSAAYRYYDAFRMTSDSMFRKNFADKAISSYQNVLKINPDNLDAKTDLGLCYAEGSTSPMQGIMLLREVVAKNPEHEMAQYNLGILSVKSGQHEKAVERFEKVLKINPANDEARYLLGRTYVLMGKKDLALQTLKVITDSKDSRMKSETENLIKQINNN